MLFERHYKNKSQCVWDAQRPSRAGRGCMAEGRWEAPGLRSPEVSLGPRTQQGAPAAGGRLHSIWGWPIAHWLMGGYSESHN
jgi:hypothetical protein